MVPGMRIDMGAVMVCGAGPCECPPLVCPSTCPAGEQLSVQGDICLCIYECQLCGFVSDSGDDVTGSSDGALGDSSEAGDGAASTDALGDAAADVQDE